MIRVAKAVFALSLACAVAACAGHAPVRLSEQDNGRAVELAAGQEFSLSLTANRTTGYSWAREDNSGIVVLVEPPAYSAGAAPAGMVGVGGVETWRLRATAAGTAVLRFAYRRPWEKGTPSARTITLNVIVR